MVVVNVLVPGAWANGNPFSPERKGRDFLWTLFFLICFDLGRPEKIS